MITNQHILSAAHCVHPKSLQSTWTLSRIRLGEFDLEADVDCDKIDNFTYCAFPPIDYDIAEYFIHERYVPKEQGNPNDIALIRISEPVRYTHFIKPVCLPIAAEDNVNIDYGTVTVAGFGRTDNRGYSTKLMKAEVDIVDRDTCNAQYQFQGRTIHNTQICAGKESVDSWWVF